MLNQGLVRRRHLLVGLVLTGALLWAVSAAQVLAAATTDDALPSDAIVVLGAAHYRGRPSPVLRARLDHAVALYRRGVAPVLVLTGGTARGDTASEAAVGRRYVLEAELPDTALRLEEAGRTTAESLKAVAELLRAEGRERVVLVSDPFHVLRARRVARRLGLQAVASPTRTDDIARRLLRQPGYFLAETIKAPLALLMTR